MQQDPAGKNGPVAINKESKLKAKSVASFLLVWLCLSVAGYAQVLTLSTNPKAAFVTQDAFISGGSIALTFDSQYASYVTSTPRLVITIDRPDILFDESRPPQAFKNSWVLNTLNVVPSPYSMEIVLDPRMYGEGFRAVSVVGFTLDVFGLNLQPGTSINAQVFCTDPAVTIANPTFRMFQVGRTPSRRGMSESFGGLNERLARRLGIPWRD